MSYYLWIIAEQRPFPFNVDENVRVMFSFNLSAMARAPVAAWEEELRTVLVDAGLATKNVDCFIGPLRTVPTGDGPYIQILDTGGEEPETTHNAGLDYERLSAQIVVRAATYGAARTRALACWRALAEQFNVTLAA